MDYQVKELLNDLSSGWTIYLTNTGFLPLVRKSNFKMVVERISTKETTRIVENFKNDGSELRYVIKDDPDAERLAYTWGFRRKSDQYVQLEQGIILFIKRKDDVIMKEKKLNTMLEHFEFMRAVCA